MFVGSDCVEPITVKDEKFDVVLYSHWYVYDVDPPVAGVPVISPTALPTQTSELAPEANAIDPASKEDTVKLAVLVVEHPWVPIAVYVYDPGADGAVIGEVTVALLASLN